MKASLRTFVVLMVWTMLAALRADAQPTGPGSALNLTAASTNYAQVSASPSLTPSNYTFEAWVAPRTAYSCCTILSRGDGGGGSDYIFEIGYNGTVCNSGKLALFTGGAWNFSTNSVPASGWAHVAASFDGTTVRFYINGVPSGSANPGGQLAQSGTVLFLGRQGTTCNCNFFDGSMDEVRIWSVIRTQTQIQQNMNHALTGSEAGLVAYYKMDEGGGIILTNSASTGASFNATNFNGLGWTTSGARFLPDLTTGIATGISSVGGTLNGSVNPGNLPTGAWFQWGTATNYGSNTATNSLAATNAALSMSNALTGLTPGMTYHFRIAATNSAGANFGGDQVLTTPAVPPSVTTLPASGLTSGTGTLNGTVNPNYLATAAWFQWGATTNYGSNTVSTSLTATNAALSVNTALGGLSPTTTYHFRAVATNSAGTNFGGDQFFTTPIVTSLGVTNLVEGPAGGLDSVPLSSGVAWTATNNAPWLQLSQASQSGTDSGTVIFSFDANPGPTRTGTLTVAGLTVTVTQAGSNYVAASLMTLVSTGLISPFGVAADGRGDVYIADLGSRTIKQLLAGSTNATTLNLPGLSSLMRVGVNAAGTAVYFCDPNLTNVWKWTPGTGAAEVLHAGLSAPPLAVTVDGADNAYVVDGSGRLTKWSAAGTVTPLTTVPQFYGGLAADAFGNLYVTSGGGVQRWSAADSTWSQMPFFGGQFDLAVDGGGNVYFLFGNQLQMWSAATSSPRTLAFSGLSSPVGVAVDGAGSVYVSDIGNNSVSELPHAFVDPTARQEGFSGGSDALPAVVPATQHLAGALAPSSDQSWLSITGVSNGVVSFSFTTNTGLARTGNIHVLGWAVPVTQAGAPTVPAITNLVEGPAAGVESVLVSSGVAWTATNNAPWLHLSATNQSGVGSGIVVFNFDANTGPTRSGTLSIGGQTLTVTQAGSTCVAASLTTLASTSLITPGGVAADGRGDVYIADLGNILFNGQGGDAIKQLLVGSTNATTLNLPGLSSLMGVGVNAAGTALYFCDPNLTNVWKWTPGTGTTEVLHAGFSAPPMAVAVDDADGAYVVDGSGLVTKWSAAGTVTPVTTVPQFNGGFFSPPDMAVDALGNIYVGRGGYQKWSAADNTWAPLPFGGVPAVAVDGGGNVYYLAGQLQVWSAATNGPRTLTSVLYSPQGVAVDGAGSVYVTDLVSNNFVSVRELPHAFVDCTGTQEGFSGGSDALAVVVPATQNLTGALAPSSDQPWLSITGVSNGVVSFSFASNTGPARTANIYVLGRAVPVTQGAGSSFLATTNLVEGSAPGLDSVLLSSGLAWTATNNAPWLHLSAANQSGAGSTNVIFSFDANPGPTRTGSLTIAGQTLTVTQAGSPYVAASLMTLLVVNGANGVAADGAGDVYFADGFNSWIREIPPGGINVTSVITSGLFNPSSVGVNAAGTFLYVVNPAQSVLKWTPGAGVTGVLQAELSAPPVAVAVDAAGNGYIAEVNGVVARWPVVGTVTNLGPVGPFAPNGEAVDALGNVYVSSGSGIQELSAANNIWVPLPIAFAGPLAGVAVDGGGNLYYIDSLNSINSGRLQTWSAATGSASTLVASGFNNGDVVAVDGAGNVYISDAYNVRISELPRAFVDPTGRPEGLNGGSDALPAVVPATQNLTGTLAPTSDQPWLSITGVTNGVVSFSFTTNTGPVRTGNIHVLGRAVPVTQAGRPVLSLTQALNQSGFQITFTAAPGQTNFTVLTTTNLAMPLSSWTAVGAPSNVGPNQFQFSAPATPDGRRFYILRSP